MNDSNVEALVVLKCRSSCLCEILPAMPGCNLSTWKDEAGKLRDFEVRSMRCTHLKNFFLTFFFMYVKP
jgi:hypothetical protein